jgi:hypothetical protein
VKSVSVTKWKSGYTRNLSSACFNPHIARVAGIVG